MVVTCLLLPKAVQCRSGGVETECGEVVGAVFLVGKQIVCLFKKRATPAKWSRRSQLLPHVDKHQ